MAALKRDFYSRSSLSVARDLLGKRLVRKLKGRLLSGVIIETEAYGGENDSASHAFKGKTPRNSVMFGPAGIAYVYAAYGIHFLLNVVAGEEGAPEAVLLRALAPLEGRDEMTRLRGGKEKALADGPAKLCQALSIDSSFNGWDLTVQRELWLEAHQVVSPDSVFTGPRIGIGYASPKDRAAPWRFQIAKGLKSLQKI